MKRSAFLAVLAALPLVGGLFREDPRDKWVRDKIVEEKMLLAMRCEHDWADVPDRVAKRCVGCGMTCEYSPYAENQYYFAKDGVYATGPGYESPYEEISRPVFFHGEYPFKSITVRPS